jgi:hypothetical protein
VDDPTHEQERSQLTPKAAPHETAAVLRMHRAGFTSAQTCTTLDITRYELIHEMKLALDLEGTAGLLGLPIHDARVPKTAK